MSVHIHVRRKAKDAGEKFSKGNKIIVTGGTSAVGRNGTIVEYLTPRNDSEKPMYRVKFPRLGNQVYGIYEADMRRTA